MSLPMPMPMPPMPTNDEAPAPAQDQEHSALLEIIQRMMESTHRIVEHIEQAEWLREHKDPEAED
jgi:hypothetical protein